MSSDVEIRDEPAGGPDAQRLFDEYMSLVRERIVDFVPSERIFATSDVFAGAGSAWLVIYDGSGAAIGCGGLRTLAPGVGEIKRMFVAAPARRRGLGRRLLRELESRAAQAGLSCVRVLTTELLSEACALYGAAGYEPIERIEREGQPVEIWLEKELALHQQTADDLDRRTPPPGAPDARSTTRTRRGPAAAPARAPGAGS